MMRPNANFWCGKRVLLTGHTGFKGGWLALWLERLGAHVTGVALEPVTDPHLFGAARVALALDSHYCNIRDADALARIVAQTRPQIVLHLAAQPLVRASYSAPLDTFGTNIMGTAHVLDALRAVDGARVAVMVTTDKVYQNLEQIYPYRESDALGGHDPYSASKAASELVIGSYRAAFLAERGVAVASARAGNVIGGGDWSADRLLPDAVRAWQLGRVLTVRHPNATRPWQHVLEPLAGYLCLAERLWTEPSYAGPFNFGPDPQCAATVGQVIGLARGAFGAGEVALETKAPALHEAGRLALETAKAHHVLGYVPRWGLQASVERTMHWYRRFLNGGDARALCLADIDAFETSHESPGHSL